MSDYLDIRDGTHDTPKYVAKGIPLITSKNLSAGTLDFSKVDFISHDDHLAISQRSKVDEGNILFTMIGSIGNPVVVKKDRDFSIKNVALFKPMLSSVTNMKYIKYFLMIAQEEMRKIARGAVQPFVSLRILRAYEFPLPPLTEQRRIATAIESAYAVIDEIEHSKADLQSAVVAAKSKIFSLAIRGKLVLQDPDDEPASVLLERIRAECESLAKAGKIKDNKSDSGISSCGDRSYYQKLK